MQAAVLLFPSTDAPDMANAAELTTQVATLEERVINHIRFFWAVIAIGFSCLLGITLLLIHTNGAVSRVEQAQANAPAQIVASLLNKPATSRGELAADLNAVSTIFQSTKVSLKKPDSRSLNTVATKLSEVQKQYPDLPQVWQATGAFINYRSGPLSTQPSGTRCKENLETAGWVFSNCEVALEELAEHIQNNMVNGAPAPFTFINCTVHYRGGAIPAKRLTFVNCVFRFEVPAIPTPAGIVAMSQLTTADSEKPIEISLG